ncbi:LAETG motif-containing sortase-dependent surface protein [Streptomyces sp. NPDC101455]|uniref:LAETG motif-containing sortase-dependent surface protein n=1 Tax=Streptomyces sp. NPDC101455 TaxID=3366142 RepID=UPI0038004777
MLTATAAGTLLGALWFVPSANATVTDQARVETSATPTSQVTQQARVTSTAVTVSAHDTQLADTGSPNTTPYIVGGMVFLGLGAGFVAYSVRRERLGF